MRPHGKRKTRAPFKERRHGDGCGTCHPSQKNLEARGRRDDDEEIDTYWLDLGGEG